MHDFFSSHIRIANTRRVYRVAVQQFSVFYAEHSIMGLIQMKPVHVAALLATNLHVRFVHAP